jgi:hypothetical protein
MFAFCTSFVTFQELAVVGRADWPRYCKITKFLSPLVGNRVIGQIVTLTKRELETPGARLHRDGCYLDPTDLRELHKWTNTRADVAEVSIQAAEQARTDKSDLQDLRVQSLSDLAAISSKGGLAALRDWNRNERPFTQDSWVEAALVHLTAQPTKPYRSRQSTRRPSSPHESPGTEVLAQRDGRSGRATPSMSSISPQRVTPTSL